MRAIRIILSGRAGNNLFQYAAGRAIATRRGLPLILDSSLIDGRTWMGSRHLLDLGLQASHHRDPTPFTRWFHRATGRWPAELAGVKIFREPPHDHRFLPGTIGQSPAETFIGYFQSPLHFASIEAALRDELTPDRWPLPPAIRAAGERLAGPRAVAVHCRRGDYVNNPNVDLLGPSYFLHAMDEMRGRVPGCRFHLFSDDPEWCRGRFGASDVSVESNPGAESNPLVDWFLMSRASHHILSNSSYAWWGAWFGYKPGQIVLVPPIWFSGIEAPVAEKCLPHWEIFGTNHKLR